MPELSLPQLAELLTDRRRGRIQVAACLTNACPGRRFVRTWHATISLRDDYLRQFWARQENARIKIPKAVESLFAEPRE